jgi:hypothetical protein
MVIVAALLACTRDAVDTDQRISPSTGSARFTSVSWHPCAHHRDGRVRCWNANQWDAENKVEDSPWPVEFFFVNNLTAWGVRTETGLAEGWDLASIEQHPVPPIQLVSGGPDCGVTPEGALECWGPNPAPTDGSGALLIGHQGGPLVLHGSGWFTGGAIWGPDLWLDASLDEPERVLDVAAYGEFGCVLRLSGEVECVPTEHAEADALPPMFEHPPYRLLDGSDYHLCAARESGVIDCSDGSTYDFGPIVDFDIVSYPDEQREGEGLLNLCVLTADDRIECEGPRYTPRLMEKVWADAG